MRFSTLIVSACVAAAAVLASPISTVKLAEVGHVTSLDGKVYDLSNTGVPNIRVITNDRKDDYYIRPVSYHVAADHICKFYQEATHGVGSLIGEFKGPLDASFGADWATFYECWHVALAPALQAREAECGFVVAPDSSLMPLNVKEGKTRFDVNEQLIIPVYYNVAEHCQCDFFVQDGRGGPSPPFPITGAKIGEFGIYRPWAYTCKHI